MLVQKLNFGTPKTLKEAIQNALSSTDYSPVSTTDWVEIFVKDFIRQKLQLFTLSNDLAVVQAMEELQQKLGIQNRKEIKPEQKAA